MPYWHWALLALVVVLFFASPGASQSCQLQGGKWTGETEDIDGYPDVVSSEDTYYFDDDSGDANGYTNDAYVYVYNALDGTAGEIGSYKVDSDVTIIDDTGVSSCTVELKSSGVYSLSQDDVPHSLPDQLHSQGLPRRVFRLLLRRLLAGRDQHRRPAARGGPQLRRRLQFVHASRRNNVRALRVAGVVDRAGGYRWRLCVHCHLYWVWRGYLLLREEAQRRQGLQRT